MLDRIRSVSRGVPWIAALAAGALLVTAALLLPPLPGLPATGWQTGGFEAPPLLLGLIGAQGAVAALTLAVALFVLQTVASRRDADDRTTLEYVRRSHVRWIFPWSVVAVGTTGTALLVGELASVGVPVLGDARGLPNVTLVGAIAFMTNMVLSGWLFERAISLASPDAWRRLRSDVNERDVRQAVQLFLDRRPRVAAALETVRQADAPDLESVFADLPLDPAEGSADEAIRALLDDARRAMDERHQANFTRALDGLRELVAHAMDELEGHGFEWSAPGGHPAWPPLAELSRHLFAFREGVITRGEREHVLALLRLDHWLLHDGVGRRCGELFSVGLGGYEASYRIAVRTRNSERRRWFRENLWLTLRDAFVLDDADEAEALFPYVREAIRLQERMLAVAMDERSGEEFRSIREDFTGMLGFIAPEWGAERWRRPRSADLHERLAQDGRIALLGLGGRALRLAGAGEMADAEPFLAVVREEYADLQRVADDIPRVYALAQEDPYYFSWLDWGVTPTIGVEVRSVDPYRYPLTFFSVQLLESAGDALPDLDMHGCAQDVLDWFSEHAEQLERHLRAAPDHGGAARRGRALAALRTAVRRDEVSEDEAAIARRSARRY